MALFWTRMADRLQKWRDADHLRTQFRLCEFSKIAGVICRGQGRWRDSVKLQRQAEARRTSEAIDAGLAAAADGDADMENDDAVDDLLADSAALEREHERCAAAFCDDT